MPRGASTKRCISHIARRRPGVNGRHQAGCTCYPESSRVGSHVTADPRGVVKCPVHKAMHGPVHTLPCMHLMVMFSLPLRTGRAVQGDPWQSSGPLPNPPTNGARAPATWSASGVRLAPMFTGSPASRLNVGVVVAATKDEGRRLGGGEVVGTAHGGIGRAEPPCVADEEGLAAIRGVMKACQERPWPKGQLRFSQP